MQDGPDDDARGNTNYPHEALCCGYIRGNWTQLLVLGLVYEEKVTFLC